MPDHGKIGLRELRSCLHYIEQAIFHLNAAATHFERARKIRLDVGDLRSIEEVIKKEVFAGIAKCMEQSLGREDRN